MQFGFLLVWLFANSPDDAAERAMNIIAELPYELIGDKFAVETRKPSGAPAGDTLSTQQGPSQETREQMALREELALESGLALMLIVVATGADETGFENAPL